MKKLLVLVVVMLVACAPLSFAACAICNATASDSYGKAALGKLGRGVANAGLGWVELFRQPVLNENKWEGVGVGVVETLRRTGSGILEAVTFFIPQVEIPQLDPTCPLEFGSGSSTTS
jgi:putative exosortase-associated protein (TIGR04073 family)